MSLDSDVIVDRRRIRRKLTFWRVVAALIAIAAIIAVATIATPGGRGALATSGTTVRAWRRGGHSTSCVASGIRFGWSSMALLGGARGRGAALRFFRL